MLDLLLDDLRRARDRLEHAMLAYGEPVDPDDLPPDLTWYTFGPVSTLNYYWKWAWLPDWLYGRLFDAHPGRGGCWRLPTAPPYSHLLADLTRAWTAWASNLFASHLVCAG